MMTLENPILKNIESGQTIEIVKSPFTIGRSLACDHVIESNVVSRTHCSLVKIDRGWVLRDLSTNGTMVNDDLYKSEMSNILKNNDEICLGFQTYTYKFLIIAEKVPNLQVKNLRSKKPYSNSTCSSPCSLSSFDDYDVSDEVLNNMADDMLNIVERQENEQSSKESSESPKKEQDNIEKTSQVISKNNQHKTLISVTPILRPQDFITLPVQQPALRINLEHSECSLIDQLADMPSDDSLSLIKEKNEPVYQVNKIIDPVQVMLQSSQSNTVTTHNSESDVKIPNLQEVSKKVEACTNTNNISNENLAQTSLVEQKESTCKHVSKEFDTIDGFNTAGAVDTFRIHFAQTLEEVIKKYTVDIDSVISNQPSRSNVSSTVTSSDDCLRTTHVNVMESNQQLVNVTSNMNRPAYIDSDSNCTNTTSASSLKVNGIKPLKLKSSLNTIKKVGRKVTTPVTESATPSVMITTSLGKSDTVHKVGTVKPISIISYSNANKKIKVMPKTRVVTTQSSDSLKPSVPPIPVSRNSMPINTLNVVRTTPLNYTVTTSRNVCLSNSQLTNATVSLPNQSVNASSATLVNSPVTSCVMSTSNVAITNNISKQGIDNQANAEGDPRNTIIYIPDSQDLAVDNPVVDNNRTTITGICENSNVEVARVCHEAQKENLNKESQTVKPSNPQTPELERKWYDEMENELMCTICVGFFCKAVTLKCSHSFCRYCIELWMEKRNDCPICRTEITSCTRTLVLDNVIEKILESASVEDKNQRRQTIRERRKLEADRLIGHRQNDTGDNYMVGDYVEELNYLDFALIVGNNRNPRARRKYAMCCYCGKTSHIYFTCPERR